MTRDEFLSCFDRYSDDVYSLCSYLAGSPQDRDDLYQETFLLAFRKMEDIRLSGNVKSYLLSLAIGLARNRRRVTRGRLQITGECSMDEEEMPEIPDSRADVEGSVLRKEEAAFLRRQVYLLPEKYRLVIVLFYLEDLPVEEIARCLRIPAGTVKSRLHSARKQLKKQMEAAGYDGS